MATHLHIGQCGAQAGLCFWDLASKHYEPNVSSSPASGPLPTLNERCPQLFHAKGNCRAVWIDTEPKDFCNEYQYRNYQRNQRLIDFDYIPDDIETDIYNEYEKVTVQSRSKILPYMIKNDLKELIGKIEEF